MAKIISYEACGTRFYAYVTSEFKEWLFVKVFKSDDPKAFIPRNPDSQCVRKDSVRIES